MLAGAILSIMLNPILFTLLERYLDKHENFEEQSMEEATEEEKQIPVNICNHAVIVGYGRVGSPVSELLIDAEIPIVVVENARTRVEAARTGRSGGIRQCGARRNHGAGASGLRPLAADEHS